MTVQALYIGVGMLFLIAAALFHFSKKLPALKSETAFEPANKAKNLLIVLTLIIFGLICVFYQLINTDPTQFSFNA